MGWVRVSDDFYDHEKFYGVTALGVATWIVGMAFANRNLTDGFVRASAVPGLVSVDGIDIDLSPRGALAGAGREASWEDGVAELVAAGLWHDSEHECPSCPTVRPGEFYIHDYLAYQPSKDDIAAKAEATRKRVAAFREKRRRERAASEGNDVSNTDGNGVRNGGVTAHPNPNPNPTTYVPETPHGGEGVQGETPRKRGRRIPEPFIVTADMRSWAATETPTVAVDAATRQFVDYWRAKAGRDAVKLDWPATWRNWLRRDAEHARPRAPAQTPTERAVATAQAGARVQAELDAQRKAIA